MQHLVVLHIKSKTARDDITFMQHLVVLHIKSKTARDDIKLHLVKSYCLPLLTYCIAAVQVKKVQDHCIVCMGGTRGVAGGQLPPCALLPAPTCQNNKLRCP